MLKNAFRYTTTINRQVWRESFLMRSVTMAAAQLGIWIYARLTDGQYKRLVVALLLLSGAVIWLRELL